MAISCSRCSRRFHCVSSYSSPLHPTGAKVRYSVLCSYYMSFIENPIDHVCGERERRRRGYKGGGAGGRERGRERGDSTKALRQGHLSTRHMAYGKVVPRGLLTKRIDD